MFLMTGKCLIGDVSLREVGDRGPVFFHCRPGWDGRRRRDGAGHL